MNKAEARAKSIEKWEEILKFRHSERSCGFCLLKWEVGQRDTKCEDWCPAPEAGVCCDNGRGGLYLKWLLNPTPELAQQILDGIKAIPEDW